MQSVPQQSEIKLPHAIDAEKAVLGAILRNPDQLTSVTASSALKADHFFQHNHRKIYSTFLELDAAAEPMDIITVADKLRRDEDAKAIGPQMLVELMEECPVTQNLDHYARIVKDTFFRRRVITACQETAKRASNSEGDAVNFIEEIEREFLEVLSEQDTSGGLVAGKDVLDSTIQELEKRIAAVDEISGVTTGFRELDAVTGGWQKSDLIILAARPGMGKTALALNLFLNSVKGGKTAVFFTLEMSKEQLMERLLSSEGRVDSSRMRKGDLLEEDNDRLFFAAKSISQFGSQLAIDETASITLSELRSRCRRYHKEHGLDMIIIDYLQLMGSSVRSDSREREVSEISKGLKALAKELAVPVISLAQLNRGADARTDKRPKVSDLRESGSIEQDADLILFIYRDEYYNPNSEKAGQAEVIIGKNRHGETGTVDLAFLPNFVSFHDLMKQT